MVTKYYAVKIGRNPGVYNSWKDCEKEVAGLKGAIYKAFKTEEEARLYVGRAEMTLADVKADTDALLAYIDGSFLEGSVYSCGCVFLHKGNLIAEISKKFSDEELGSMRNVAGEIKAAQLAMDFALKNKYKELIICHDYEGISRWPLGEWTPTRKGTRAYKKYYEEMTKKIDIKFVKVKAHSGNEYNEMADRLAKKALGIEK